MARVIKIVPYDPLWPELFQVEAINIKQALADNCLEIHHIGSTSIPNLAAKPILDLMPVVKNIMAIEDAALIKLGYTACGEYGMPFR